MKFINKNKIKLDYNQIHNLNQKIAQLELRLISGAPNCWEDKRKNMTSSYLKEYFDLDIDELEDFLNINL